MNYWMENGLIGIKISYFLMELEDGFIQSGVALIEMGNGR